MKPTTHIWTKIGGRQNWFQKVKKKLLSNFAGKIICKKLTPNDPYNSVLVWPMLNEKNKEPDVRDDVSLKVSSLHRFILNIAYIELLTDRRILFY